MAKLWYVEKRKGKAGRPSRYNDSMRALIIRCCYEGMTDYQIAVAIGVKRNTIYRWRNNDQALKEAMDRIRKEVAKATIEQGLLKLSQGYEQEEITTESIDIDDDGNPVKVKKTRKYYPPNVKAMEMLASKHCPNDYIKKEVKETNVNVKITQKNRALTAEERLSILEADKNAGAIEASYRSKDDLKKPNNSNKIESFSSPPEDGEDVDV